MEIEDLFDNGNDTFGGLYEVAMQSEAGQQESSSHGHYYYGTSASDSSTSSDSYAYYSNHSSADSSIANQYENQQQLQGVHFIPTHTLSTSDAQKLELAQKLAARSMQQPQQQQPGPIAKRGRGRPRKYDNNKVDSNKVDSHSHVKKQRIVTSDANNQESGLRTPPSTNHIMEDEHITTKGNGDVMAAITIPQDGVMEAGTSSVVPLHTSTIDTSNIDTSTIDIFGIDYAMFNTGMRMGNEGFNNKDKLCVYDEHKRNGFSVNGRKVVLEGMHIFKKDGMNGLKAFLGSGFGKEKTDVKTDVKTDDRLVFSPSDSLLRSGSEFYLLVMIGLNDSGINNMSFEFDKEKTSCVMEDDCGLLFLKKVKGCVIAGCIFEGTGIPRCIVVEDCENIVFEGCSFLNANICITGTSTKIFFRNCR